MLQCPSCSLHKSDKVAGSDPITGTSVPLFDPLRLSWREHFRLEPDGACVGLTPIGRATVIALGMNGRVPRFARACQIMLGLLKHPEP